MFGSPDIPDGRRRAQRLVNVALVVGVALLYGVVGWYIMLYQPSAVETRDQQQHRIACVAADDPSKAADRALRRDMHCPALPVPKPTKLRSASPSAKVHAAPAPTRQSRVTVKPSATPAHESTRPAVSTPRKRQAPTQGRVSRSATVAPSKPTSSPSRRPVLGPVCDAVKLPLLCRTDTP